MCLMCLVNFDVRILETLQGKHELFEEGVVICRDSFHGVLKLIQKQIDG